MLETPVGLWQWARMSDVQTFIKEANDLLGPRGFSRDPEMLEPWLTDWRGRFHGQTIGLASPASTREVSEFVKLCDRYAVPIVPQGGNSGMVGGATPDESGHSVILSLRRMDDVRSFDVDARQIVCDAGVILQNLHETVEQKGLRFPLTLGGKGSATVGGLIATNAGGSRVVRFGTMRQQIVGVEAGILDRGSQVLQSFWSRPDRHSGGHSHKFERRPRTADRQWWVNHHPADSQIAVPGCAI